MIQLSGKNRSFTCIILFVSLIFYGVSEGYSASVIDTIDIKDVPASLTDEDAGEQGKPADSGKDAETESSDTSRSDLGVNDDAVPDNMKSQETLVPDVSAKEENTNSTSDAPDAASPIADQSKSHEIVVLKQLTGPRQTVQFFIDACQDTNYPDAVRSMDFSQLPELNEIEREDYAHKLLMIMIRLDNFSVSDIPDTFNEDDCYLWPDHNYKALCLHRHKDGTWKFDASTISDIPTIYNEIKNKRPVIFKGTFLGSLPDFFFNRFLCFAVIQWLFLLVFIGIGLLMLRAIPFITSKIILFFGKIRRKDKDFSKKFRWALRPLAYIVMLWFWFAGLRYVGADPKVLTLAIVVLHPLCVVMLVQLLLRLIDIFKYWLQLRLECDVNKVKSVLVDLSVGILKFLVLASGVIAVAQIFGFSAVGIVSGMGIGGIAVALAAQQTISNFFGSMTILLDHPFMVGDYIIVGNIEGVVERIGLRSTSIKTFYESHVVIPNGQLAADVVDNMGRRQSRRFKTNLGLQYDTPVPLIRAFSSGVRRLVERHPSSRNDDIRVSVNDFGPSSIDIQLICYFVVNNVHQELKARESLILSIVTLADKLGVSFAFPSQTTYMVPTENLTYPMQERAHNPEEAAALGKEIAEEICASLEKYAK